MDFSDIRQKKLSQVMSGIAKKSEFIFRKKHGIFGGKWCVQFHLLYLRLEYHCYSLLQRVRQWGSGVHCTPKRMIMYPEFLVIYRKIIIEITKVTNVPLSFQSQLGFFSRVSCGVLHSGVEMGLSFLKNNPRNLQGV